MKVWISGVNLDEDEWNSWRYSATALLSEVKLNSIHQYSTSSTHLAMFDYEYFERYNIKTLTSKVSIDGMCYIDGWVNYAGSRSINTTLVYSDILKEKLDQTNLSKFQGEFAIIELVGDQLTLVTDFYATKPIYYSIDNKKIFATNDIRLLIINNNIKWSINEDKCVCFLSSYGALGENEISDNETFFNNISKIPPSSVLIFSGSNLNIRSYINYQEDVISTNYKYDKSSNYPGQFKEYFDKAVYHRIQNLKPALMLSGGIDSSTILAAISNLRLLEQVTTFNMSFRDPDLYNSQDSEIAARLIRDFEVKGGIIWADDILRIPNISLSNNSYDDPFNFIDGPNPSANRLSQEVFAYYGIKSDSDVMLTGEQGDAVLGEDNIILIYDSLIKSGLYKDAYELLLYNVKVCSKIMFFKILVKYCLFNLSLKTRNYHYRNTYWEHTKTILPSYFEPKLIDFEASLLHLKNDVLSSDYDFPLVGHMYIFDYFFPRASYFDSMNSFMPHSHPFIDPNILGFIFANPTHIHCNYKSYRYKESYASAKYLARKAYRGVLPDYARLKSKKTSYAGMARKILLNSKKDLISLLFDRDNLYISEMELINNHKFKKHVGAVILKLDDPNNNLGLSYQLTRVAIQTEIWLSIMNLPQADLIDKLKFRPPRQLVDIEWINK